MTNTILILSNDNEFIEQVQAAGDYEIQVENTLPIALADVLLCIVDVATVAISVDWVIDSAKKSQIAIAFDTEQQIATYFNLAVVDFWMKPIHSIELHSRLRNLINLHHVQQMYHQQTKMTYSVVYEIRNAIVPIRGYSEVLLTSELKENLTEQQLEILSIILTNVKTIQAILHDQRDKNLDAP